MRILFYDLMQVAADAPASLISPALADVWLGNSLTVTFANPRSFDCVGIGNTDATVVTVAGQPVVITDQTPFPDDHKNGLYLLQQTTVSSVSITHNGTYIGRLALGMSRRLGCGKAREPGFWTTTQSRTTLSGQVVSGAGGVSGRRIDVDFRYKIDRSVFDDIELAYPGQLSRGYPLFMIFDEETERFPWLRLYAQTDEDLLFQSSIRRMLHSRKFSFMERF